MRVWKLNSHQIHIYVKVPNAVWTLECISNSSTAATKTSEAMLFKGTRCQWRAIKINRILMIPFNKLKIKTHETTCNEQNINIVNKRSPLTLHFPRAASPGLFQLLTPPCLTPPSLAALLRDSPVLSLPLSIISLNVEHKWRHFLGFWNSEGSFNTRMEPYSFPTSVIPLPGTFPVSHTMSLIGMPWCLKLKHFLEGVSASVWCQLALFMLLISLWYSVLFSLNTQQCYISLSLAGPGLRVPPWCPPGWTGLPWMFIPPHFESEGGSRAGGWNSKFPQTRQTHPHTGELESRETPSIPGKEELALCFFQGQIGASYFAKATERKGQQ